MNNLLIMWSIGFALCVSVVAFFAYAEYVFRYPNSAKEHMFPVLLLIAIPTAVGWVVMRYLN